MNMVFFFHRSYMIGLFLLPYIYINAYAKKIVSNAATLLTRYTS
jgi:hypothetical protein